MLKHEMIDLLQVGGLDLWQTRPLLIMETWPAQRSPLSGKVLLTYLLLGVAKEPLTIGGTYLTIGFPDILIWTYMIINRKIS